MTDSWTPENWALGPADGELRIRTGVAGPGAKMGHRLTLRMASWQADVTWHGDEPVQADLSVDVGSLQVLEGHGGVTPLSGPEKLVVRSNALKSLNAKKFPTIRFTSTAVTKTDQGYQLDGTLEIHGQRQPQTVDLTVDDEHERWVLSAEVPVTQPAFGIKPFSLLMGSLRVADEVTVQFSGSRVK